MASRSSPDDLDLNDSIRSITRAASMDEIKLSRQARDADLLLLGVLSDNERQSRRLRLSADEMSQRALLGCMRRSRANEIGRRNRLREYLTENQQDCQCVTSQLAEISAPRDQNGADDPVQVDASERKQKLKAEERILSVEHRTLCALYEEAENSVRAFTTQIADAELVLKEIKLRKRKLQTRASTGSTVLSF